MHNDDGFGFAIIIAVVLLIIFILGVFVGFKSRHAGHVSIETERCKDNQFQILVEDMDKKREWIQTSVKCKE